MVLNSSMKQQTTTNERRQIQVPAVVRLTPAHKCVGLFTILIVSAKQYDIFLWNFF